MTGGGSIGNSIGNSIGSILANSKNNENVNKIGTIISSTVVASITKSSKSIEILSNTIQSKLYLLDDILCKLNFPPFIAFIGILLFIQLSSNPISYVSSSKNTIPSLLSTQIYNLLAYILNVYSVSQPGRNDGYQPSQQSQQKSNKKKQKKCSDSNSRSKSKLSTTTRTSGTTGTSSSVVIRSDYFQSQEKSLVNPSGWAFAIWGPIFLGELVMTTIGTIVLYFIRNKSNDQQQQLVLAIRKSSKSFVYAQVFQSLWSISFRPKYFLSNNIFDMSISVFMLSNIALSLNNIHKIFSKLQMQMLNPFYYILYSLPISLHFGWTTAATLVNLNGIVAVFDNSILINRIGISSVLFAILLGIYITKVRSAPVYSLVIAWALAACSTGLNKRILLLSASNTNTNTNTNNTNNNEQVQMKDDNNSIVLLQQRLCQFGCIVLFYTAITTIFYNVGQFQQQQLSQLSTTTSQQYSIGSSASRFSSLFSSPFSK